MAKVSFITTVFNESKTIESFLQSLMSQTRLPDEVVIVDAYSSDGTLNQIKHFFADKKIKTVFLQEKGNIAHGRNTAITHATSDIIAISDAGCILDKQWLEKLISPFENNQRQATNLDVVSGFYFAKTQNIFEKCLSTYTCTQPELVNPQTYLPSSRSIAFTKNVWESVGKYPENLDWCEDLVFAKKLKTSGARMVFVKDAFVWWPQRKNIKDAALQFYHYAYGDGQAWYIRRNTPFLFVRYLFILMLLFVYLQTRSPFMLYSLFLLLILYIFWAIKKNYRFVKNPHALWYLPLLQFTADGAVLSGMTAGILSVWATRKTL